jgi:hypothetical protein
MGLTGSKLVLTCVKKQRWASTLANRSNARHQSNIRASPRPLPPDICIQSVEICVARGAGSDSLLAWVLGCHIFDPAPHAPTPKGIGQRSKVVILPTTVKKALGMDLNAPCLHLIELTVGVPLLSRGGRGLISKNY